MKRIRVPGTSPKPHLSQSQFYHVAPYEARENIEKHGIDYTKGTQRWSQTQAGEGNFLWTNRNDAYTYRRGAEALSRSDDSDNWLDSSGQSYDVYEVNLPKINRPKLEEDPEFIFGAAVKTLQPLPRRFVRRIG